MRTILIDTCGKVHTYQARDGAIVLLCDDQPEAKLFERKVSDEELRKIVQRHDNGDRDIYVNAWIAMV